MIRADLHIHTTYSPDSTITPKVIVNQLFAHPFIKVIAISDHNTAKGYNIVQRLASAYQDILIIPGVEISAYQGDLIILGVAKLPPKPWTGENVIDFAHERNALVIAAHPYREFGLGDSARNYNIDAVEVLNGNASLNANTLAQNLAKEMGLPGIAGSDAHKINELWTVYTEVKASLDTDEILKALKKGLVNVSPTDKSIHF